MKAVETEIPDVKVVRTDRHEDRRGSFSEEYHRLKYAELGIDTLFVQDNQSVSLHAGTVRGLHFQVPPFAQAKLVRVVSGAILDVVIDIRRGSSDFGKHVSVCLGADSGEQIFVPEGFAHGFCTLTPNTVVVYKVSHYYARNQEAGILWNDPDLQIAWPVQDSEALLSAKDRELPRFRDIADSVPFQYTGRN
jgi:dTDP-4-dehydrorhamnose 3,5-epimerase